jgi:glycosyltransferase involved in cell wall biosynthesis
VKILNVNNTLDPVNGGGTAMRTLQVSRFLSSLDAECTILSLDTGVTRDLHERAGKVRIVTLPCRIERYFVPSMSWNTVKDLVCSADVIQMMNHWTLLNAMVFHYAALYEKPYILCPAGAIPIFGRSKVLKRSYDIAIGRKILRHAKACVAITPKEVEAIKAYGVPGEMISVIPNGIDPGDYLKEDDSEFRRKYGLPDAPFLLYVGRLNPIKGPDLLLEAFMRAVRSKGLPHHLVFAGPDGGMLHGLETMALANDMAGRVHFLGFIGGDDKSRAYHAAEFLVIPSRQEAMSIVVLEAGICKTAVLLTDRCGFDNVADVEGGMVVSASIDGLQEGIEIMTGNSSGLEIMGENLMKFVGDRYLWKHTAKQYLDLFNKVAG